MSTTTEVDLELEEKNSYPLDVEEDISAEFKEIENEIKNYANIDYLVDDDDVDKNNNEGKLENNNMKDMYYDNTSIKMKSSIKGIEKKEEKEIIKKNNSNPEDESKKELSNSRPRFLSI